MGDSAETAVLVIGAGPSGLFAAVELARHGVHARVIEREPHPHHQARATALQPGTLEILQQAGVLDRVLPACEQLAFARVFRVFDSGLACVSELAIAGAGCEWEYQCCLPQWRTEQILADRLTELGGVVERGVSVISLTERDDGVLVGLASADGTRRNVEAAWVIGAGGAHSTTRESMDEPLTGSTYPGTALVADVEVTADLPRDGSALIASPAGYVLLAPLPADRWITFIGDLDDAEIGRLADRLGLELRERARPCLLDSFAWERQAADRHVLQVSDRLHQLAYAAVESAQSGSPPAAPPGPEAVAALVRARSMLDVSYQGSPLTGERLGPGTPPLPAPAPGDRYPARARMTSSRHEVVVFGPAAEEDLTRLRRRWHGIVDVGPGTGDPRPVGLAADGAVLIRPDGYIGFRAAPADHASFRALDRHLGSYLAPASA